MFRNITGITIKVLVFIAVAVGTAFLVNRLNNANYDSATKEMTESVLPIVFCQYRDEPVNLMRGYSQVMSTKLMRDGIIPMSESNGVDVLVYDDGEFGASYSYELRTVGGDSLIEEGELSEGEPFDGYRKYSVNFRMDIKLNREYVFVFIIADEEGNKARYYTRTVKLETEHAGEIIEFATKFHNTTFIKERDEENKNIVEENIHTTGSGADDDLSHVSLDSTYEMISWGGMNPITLTAVIPTITELDKDYAVIQFSYVVATKSENVTHYYNVDEYYSVRYDGDREKVELLAFDRYLESIFDQEYISKERNAISMGIADIEATEYASSDENSRLAFVKAGQLWYYNYNASQLTSVFDMQQGNYGNIRYQNADIDINIAKLDDEGNIYFVVYGYFNRGKHEGKNGISLNYYDAEASVVEELCFIQSNEPFDVMKQEVGRFTFYDGEKYMYYLLDGSIFRVNLTNMTQDTLVTGLPSSKYMVSDNRKIVVYPNAAEEQDVTDLTIYNFEQNIQTEITGDKNDRLLALGFVGNDLIYGVADAKDVVVTVTTEVIMPLYKICIEDPYGKELKNYSKDGIYVMSTEIRGDNIYLTRVVKNEGYYEECEADYISYKKAADVSEITVAYSRDKDMMKLVDIVLPSNMYINKSVNPLMTKNRMADKYTEMRDDASGYGENFYVFNNSGFEGGYKSAGRAIIAVNNEGAGLVVDANGNTIYRSLEAVAYNTVANKIDKKTCETVEETLLTCAYMCIELIDNRVDYEDVVKCDSWEAAFEENTLGVGINISGIDLGTALYFLDRDIPFAACIDDGRYVLVISYNSTHIRYYDPIKGEEIKVVRSYFEKQMATHGNKLYTYTSQ